MAMFTDTVTVYNYKQDRQGNETWQRTVVTGCMWSDIVVKSVGSDGIHIAKTVRLTFLPRPDYVDYRKFRNVTDTRGLWTLDPEENLDVVVYGACTDEITEDFPLKQLMEKHRCATVKEVNDNRNHTHLPNIKAVCD